MELLSGIYSAMVRGDALLVLEILDLPGIVGAVQNGRAAARTARLRSSIPVPVQLGNVPPDGLRRHPELLSQRFDGNVPCRITA